MDDPVVEIGATLLSADHWVGWFTIDGGQEVLGEEVASRNEALEDARSRAEAAIVAWVKTALGLAS